MTTTSPSRNSERDVTLDPKLEFALHWVSYGGGPAEDIMDRFGQTPAEFFGELQRTLELDDRTLPPRVKTSILTCCRRRLWVAG